MSKQSARERMHQRRGQQQRRTQITLIIVVAVLALGVVGLLIAFNQPRTPVTFSSGNFSGIPESVDQSGTLGMVLGPADAPVSLVEYADFSCPHCHDLEPTIHQLIDTYVKPGKLKITYKTVTFVGGANSDSAARGMICAAAQGKAWEMHDAIWTLYDNQTYQGYTEANMNQLATNLKLDQTKFSSCYNSATTTDAIQAVQDELPNIGVTATPTLFLNGTRLDFSSYDDILNAIQQKAASAAPAAGATAASPTP